MKNYSFNYVEIPVGLRFHKRSNKENCGGWWGLSWGETMKLRRANHLISKSKPESERQL